MGDKKRRRLEYESSDGCAANFSSVESHGTESLQFESCPQFSLIGFKRYADYFKQCYFSTESEVSNRVSPTSCLDKQEPSEQSIEGEYWRIVEKPTDEIEVLCGTGNLSSVSTISISTQQKSDSVESSASAWDLNPISSLPGSLLSFENPDLARILVPQLHIGMCFSSVPWTLEEHSLYMLHYLHLGAPRTWYGISQCDAQEFEVVMEKHFPNTLKRNGELIQKLGNQTSLGTLKSEGVPVYRCVQRPGDFVLFLPGAYHSGFDCGFNCSASAVFAPLYWLPHGLTSTELYRERKMRTSISYDKLLLRAANEVVKARWANLVKGEKTSTIMMWKEASGKEGVITKALRARIGSEARCRRFFSPTSQSEKMDKSFDSGGQKRECCTCFYDLYLSAATCPCNPSRYSCLAHAKHLCSLCPWTKRTFLFRYQNSELNILAEALEGKITPMRDWLREDLASSLECDELDGQNGLTNPSSVTEASAGGAPTDEKNQASGSTMLSKEKDPVVEELFTDDFKKKALEYILKGSDDDTSSSSSSDFDIDAAIAELESQKAKSSLLTSNQKQ